MTPPIERILISEDQLQRRVWELADHINRDYRGEELVLISILKGSVLFLSDLMKRLHLDVEIGFIHLSSYQGESAPQTEVQEYLAPFPPVEGRHVLLVEDILDTGASLHFALNQFQKRNPKSLKTCILLIKKGIERKEEIHADYHGFYIPNDFVVGYGLDYQEKFRQLPYIAVLNPAKFKASKSTES